MKKFKILKFQNSGKLPDNEDFELPVGFKRDAGETVSDKEYFNTTGIDRRLTGKGTHTALPKNGAHEIQ